MTVNVGGQRRGRGVEAVAGEEKKEDQIKINPSDYSCEVILEKTTKDKANDRKLPTDDFEFYYVGYGEDRLDVTRSGKMVNVFDLYYTKYGKDALKKIEYGQGTVNPSQWGYKEPPKKKRRKG